MLPTVLVNLILEFHDEFDIARKKRQLHYVIRRGYQNWLMDSGLFSSFYNTSEYHIKQEIYPYCNHKVFITNYTRWKSFLAYFRRCEAWFFSDRMELIDLFVI